jgi:hypothetical protein
VVVTATGAATGLAASLGEGWLESIAESTKVLQWVGGTQHLERRAAELADVSSVTAPKAAAAVLILEHKQPQGGLQHPRGQ